MSDSPLLELAEHYYVVARDLESQGREQLRVAALLRLHADQLCEQNMRQSPIPSNPTKADTP